MLELDGQKLSLAQVVAVARDKDQVSLSEAARTRVEQARKVVEEIVAEGRTVYGVNTGFGKLSDVHIERSQLRELQLNLVRSHSCGLGSPLSEAEARALLLLRANVLAAGFSGCRPVLIESLIVMLNRGVTPVIPEKGSVGASGDLAPHRTFFRNYWRDSTIEHDDQAFDQHRPATAVTQGQNVRAQQKHGTCFSFRKRRAESARMTANKI